MNYRRLRQAAGNYVASCLLILVALVQKYNVRTQDQLAGRGGGFGMFSTVDTAPTRMARFYLLTDQGEALVIDPRRTGVLGAFYVESLLIRPADEHLREAAHLIATTPWSIFSLRDLEDISSRLPDDLETYLAEEAIWRSQVNLASEPDSSRIPDSNGSYASRIAIPRSAADDSSGFTLYGVRAEIWKSTFDRRNHRLVSSKLKELVIEVDNPY